MVKARVVKSFGGFHVGKVIEISPADFEEYNDHLIKVCSCQNTTADFKEWKEKQSIKEFKDEYKTK